MTSRGRQKLERIEQIGAATAAAGLGAVALRQRGLIRGLARKANDLEKTVQTLKVGLEKAQRAARTRPRRALQIARILKRAEERRPPKTLFHKAERGVARAYRATIVRGSQLFHEAQKRGLADPS